MFNLSNFLLESKQKQNQNKTATFVKQNKTSIQLRALGDADNPVF